MIKEKDLTIGEQTLLSDVISSIQLQPTAYDADKVVKQLKQQAEQYRERGFEADRERSCDFADKCYAKQYSYLHAIEIVKEGGVNDAN